MMKCLKHFEVDNVKLQEIMNKEQNIAFDDCIKHYLIHCKNDYAIMLKKSAQIFDIDKTDNIYENYIKTNN